MSIVDQSRLNRLLGKTAPVAYRAVLLAHGDVQICTVFRYVSPPSLQERIAITDFENDIIKRALSIREGAKIPFWEAVFSACIQEGRCSSGLLKATFFHNGQGAPVEYQRSDLESGILESLTEGNSLNVSLGSKVFDGRNECRHLNLLDFHCDISESNTRLVYQVCRELMPHGFLILDSGDSYHAASIDLVSPEQRVRMLGKALLVSPIVDVPYIAHQLQQDSSSIRISRGGKAKKIPVVIDAWCPDQIR